MLGIGNSSFAQKNLLKKLFSSEQDTSRSNTFLPIPTISYAQETGVEFGLTGLFSFYTDRQDKENRGSSLSGDATYSTEKQATARIKTDVWTIKNKYHYQAEVRYKNFPFYFYGIGSQTKDADKDLILERLQHVVFEAEKQFKPGYYLGLTAGFDSYAFEEKTPGGIFTADSLIGKNGGTVLFIGLSQIIDNRNSNIYTTKGTYLKLNYSYNPNFFDGDNFEGSLFKLDFRAFKTLQSNLVLGFNANYQALVGGSPPFYLLPQLGNEMMRGYYTGRYRDQNLLAAQFELRYRFKPRFAVVGFLGAGNVYGITSFQLAETKSTFGGGFRYFFEVERGLSLMIDYGFGEKAAGESRQQGLNIGIGQAF
mgnify:CR=1 FL=1